MIDSDGQQVPDGRKEPNTICLICSCIPSSKLCEEQDQLTESGTLLRGLARLFKVSKSIYSELSLETLPAPLLCIVCNERVREMLELEETIRKMEEELQKAIEAVQEEIILNYQVDKKTFSGESDSLGLRLIRKTYAQCWASCTVPLRAGACEKDYLSALNKSVSRELSVPVGNSEIDTENEIDGIKVEILTGVDPDAFEGHLNDGEDAEDSVDPLWIPDSDFHGDGIGPRVSVVIKDELNASRAGNEDQNVSLSKPVSPRKMKITRGKKGVSTNISLNSQLNDAATPRNISPREFRRKMRSGNQTTVESPSEVRSSDDPKANSCGICGKTYAWKSGLREHLRSHKPLTSARCDVCGKGFFSRNHLRVHKKSHEDPTRKDNVCEVCGKSYRNKSGLQIHMFSHEDSAPFQCEVCGRRFFRPDALRKHAFTHVDAATLPCERCEQLYKTPESLQRHVQRCRKQTGPQSGTHLNFKDNENEINDRKCPVCHIVIPEHVDYDRHVELHSRKKEFQCSDCSSSYRSMSQLNMHTRVKHGDQNNQESTHSCDLCGKEFIRFKALINHRTKKHGIVLEPWTEEEGHGESHHGGIETQGEDAKICNACGQIFQTHAALMTHLSESHTEIKLEDNFRRMSTDHPGVSISSGCESFIKISSTTSLRHDVLDRSEIGREYPSRSKGPAAANHLEHAALNTSHGPGSLMEIIMEPNDSDMCSSPAVPLQTDCPDEFEVEHFRRGHENISSEKGRKSKSNTDVSMGLMFRPDRVDSNFLANADVSAKPSHETVSEGEKSEEDIYGEEMQNVSRKCPFCKLILTKRVNYDQHVKLHDGAKDFPCKECPFRFPTVPQLINHNRLKHGTKGNKFCRICVRTVPWEDFKEHQRDQHGITNIDAVYDSEKNLISFECRACNETFRKEAYMNSENQVQVCCDHGSCGCKEMFKDLQEFMSHHKKVCTLLFWVNRPSFTDPSSSCETQICKICGKSFGRQDILDAHILINHNETNKKKDFNTKVGVAPVVPPSVPVSINIVQRSGELYPFVCQTCGKCFQSKHSLKEHVTVHTDERPFVCDICGKDFRTSKRLKEHLECHVETLDFPCHICGKLFKSRHRVNSHVYSFHDKRRAPRSTKKILTG